ncbi:PLP-dependent aminotransferase family protein [Bacillus salitolerans]|uniref:PLP-dependent aminotransferase family protein n=1 Tax=Bacillus salitolerans TaxID=1437434 RepID=A0ABW4LR58_9BACI
MEFIVVLDERLNIPLYQQLYESLKKAIYEGTLTPGTKLPSVRQMARAHNISKMTVESGYQQLLAEGYIESRARSGFYVVEIDNLEELNSDRQFLEYKYTNAAHLHPQDSILYNFHGSEIDISTFPIRNWRRCMNEAMDNYYDNHAFYGEPQGEYDLRIEIANYLQQSRTVKCMPEQIIVGSGLQQTISFLCILLSKDGNRIAWEDPGYSGARSVCTDHGWEVVPISLEEDGINIDELRNSDANAVLVTPAHQYPYGMVMPIGKRIKLLEWARQNGSVILEEDYDGEFRYGIKPIPSLQGMDTHGSVIYIGNFSKAFSPAIRMNYMVLPYRLLRRYHDLKLNKYPSPVSRIQQRAMQIFMQKGYWAKHVRKMRTVYAKKQAVLIEALRKYMGDRIRIMGQFAGLHLIIEVDTWKKQNELIKEASKHGVKVYPVERGQLEENMHPQMRPRILLGFGGLSPLQINEGVMIIANVWFGD